MGTLGGSSSSFDDDSPAAPAREMIGSGGGGRSTAADGGKATKQKQKQKQPQRGLGVAQLEKIRLHNHMLAAYRSAAQQQGGHDVHKAASSATIIPAGPSSLHHLTNRCFEETDHHHRQGVVQYYDGLLPHSRTPAPTTPALYAHDVRDSSGHRLGHPPPQQHYWMASSRSDGASAEELDLELRL